MDMEVYWFFIALGGVLVLQGISTNIAALARAVNRIADK